VQRRTEVLKYGQPAPDHTADAESLAGLYAFGALDGAEYERFERHFRGCGRCAEVVDGDLAIVSSLHLTVPDVEPSPGFKERLLERAATELVASSAEGGTRVVTLHPRRSAAPSLAWLLPLAAIMVALFAGIGLLSQQLNSAQVTQTAVLDNRTTVGRATVLVRRSGDGVIQMNGFDDLRDGQVYQAWVIRPGSPPLATGATTNGSGTLTLDGDIRGTKVAVTLEPGPGASAPSSQPFVIGDVPT